MALSLSERPSAMTSADQTALALQPGTRDAHSADRGVVGLRVVSRAARLWIVLFLNLLLVAGLIVVGISAHSPGVLAEGADYLADAAAIAVSLVAVGLSRLPRTPSRPRGYPRATAFAAMVNGSWLLVLTILVLAGAVNRLATGVRHRHGLPALNASAVSGTVIITRATILRG